MKYQIVCSYPIFNMPKDTKFKRLYIDIETSPNVVFSWNVGYDLQINYENIIEERQIICICYKWANEKQVYSIKRTGGNEKSMLKEITKVMNEADQIVGHNGNKFDIPWIRTRCLFYGIPMIPDYKTIDTLKLCRSGFRLNSNKLDYVAQFLGLGKKMDTGGFGLWKEICLNKSAKALQKMIDYCKKDVILLEKVYDKISPYVKHTMHVGVIEGKDKCSCVECGSVNVQSRGYLVNAGGGKKRRLNCQDCGSWYSIPIKLVKTK